ncbi:TWiK family of potassium channels protein 7-like [Centruroides sculpturatus]|uniref:TWiK family of potassium channels protein 7-like n=1 Tax=Centruroides sculpturatus TaxID=218467 RepID=UPI000C6DF80F|nr:TWiK family of potassium channels protein 7-like [Centruroides sculpturatus]
MSTTWTADTICSKCRHTIQLLAGQLFSHFGLCCLVLCYCILGALVFAALESTHEKDQRGKVRQFRDSCLRDLWDITDSSDVLYERNWTRMVVDRLKQFEKDLVRAVKKSGFDGKETEDPNYLWTFSSSLLYSVTVISTIGCGNMSPKTQIGKVLTIVYAIMGIPLMLMCLTNIGDMLARSFRNRYRHLIGRDRMSRESQATSENETATRDNKSTLATIDVIADTPIHPAQLENCNCSIKRSISEAKDGEMGNSVLAAYSSPSPQQEKEERMDCQVPIYVVVAILLSYIALGATVFSLLENWNFLNGVYFCFVTLSTIGFGDLVPGTASMTSNSQIKLLFCCFYLIVGLGIIAMSFNLVQEEVIAKCKKFGRRIGLLSEPEE